MAERKTLTITQVNDIQKVGEKQIPKLSFKAKDADGEFLYSTFRSSLFDAIKQGSVIDAEVDVKQDGDWINRRVVQIYVNGQPIGGQKQGFRGKSPEELELSARAYALSYAKDLVNGDKLELGKILDQATAFHKWLTNGKPISQKGDESQSEPQQQNPTTETVIQNITEFKGLLNKHRVGTHEAYEILSINSFTELVDLDEAWEKIKEAKDI